MKSLFFTFIRNSSLAFFMTILFLSPCYADASSQHQAVRASVPYKSSNQWFKQGRETVLDRKKYLQQQAIESKSFQEKAKNIIFILGDGMGVSTLTSSRIYAGQQQGLMGEEYSLSFERFPYSALIKTYNVDLQIPDSAGTMSALMTGVKTNEGIIGLPASVTRGDCHSIKKEQSLTTLIDIAKAKGKLTGVVTTARVTHATPAATYAHSADRNWESDDQLTESALRDGCKDIAAQLIDAEHAPLDLLFGGGRRHFLPKKLEGKRLDQRNLIEQWKQQGGRYLSSLKQLQELKTADTEANNNIPLLGLFARSHMSYEYQRPKGEPSLKQMTAAALQYLEHNEQGYALIIESGRIDHGHHNGTAYKALTETQHLHKTIEWLLTQVDLKETLIVVTADHSHGMAMAGYATRGNPILAHVIGNDEKGNPKQKVTLDEFGQPYTSLSYRDGPGAVRNAEQSKDTLNPNYRQIALVPMDYESHGGEDVALYAIGPQAQLFSGTLEQHWVFHALKYAM